MFSTTRPQSGKREKVKGPNLRAVSIEEVATEGVEEGEEGRDILLTKDDRQG